MKHINITKKQAVIVTVLLLIIFIMTLLVSKRVWFRLDFTKGKSFTISAVSRNLHTEIEDQVQITYYLSDRLKSMHPIPAEIEDFLREYARYSRGKIRLIVRDPARANMTQLVEQLGIFPQQIQTLDQDQASIITVYSGIVIEYNDQIDVLPVVFSPETLEYELTSRIRSMVREKARVMGILVGDNPRSWNEEFAGLQSMFMMSGYQFRLIMPGMSIPDTLPALMVIGGSESLDEDALYQIDHYIQAGGRVLFLTRSVFVDIESGLEASLVDDQGLLAMLSHYGVTILPEIAMDRTALTMQYQTRSPSGIVQVRISRNPQWIRILGENGNPEHPVSALFSGLDMYWPNPLMLHPPQGIEAVPLFTTTGEAWSIREPFYTNVDVPYLMERDMSATMGTKVMGASLTGVFPSWFADRPFPDDTENPVTHSGSARIMVIGNIEFATSFMGVTGGQNNLNFLLAAADWLFNDDDIIGIRNRTDSSGRLDRILDPERRVAAMRLAQFINIILIPLFVIVAGVFFALRRRARAKEYQHGV